MEDRQVKNPEISYWVQVREIALELLSIQAPGWTFAQAEEKAYELYAEYRSGNAIRSLLPLEALHLPDLVGVLFFEHLAQAAKIHRKRPKSPVTGEKDDSWMNKSSFCFFNIRGVGKEVNSTGNFIEATRLLPLLRVKGLHLAPFFECIMGVIYSQDSFSIINDEVTQLTYEKRGMSRFDQLRYFIDCAHLLGKAIGVDVTPHTAGLSRVCLSRPEIFRWVRFSTDRLSFYNNESIDNMYTPKRQRELAMEIKKLIQPLLEIAGITDLDDETIPLEISRKVLMQAKKLVTDEGYFPVPPPTWNGIGAPGVESFYLPGNYPIWEYRDIYGDDQSIHSIGIHASFMFHHNMRANRLPRQLSRNDADWDAYINEEAVDYLADFFLRCTDCMGLTFSGLIT